MVLSRDWCQMSFRIIAESVLTGYGQDLLQSLKHLRSWAVTWSLERLQQAIQKLCLTIIIIIIIIIIIKNVAYENSSDPCGCWRAWYSEEGCGRKHQGSSERANMTEIQKIGMLWSARILRKVLSVWTEWLTWVTDALGAWFVPGWCTKRTPAKTVLKEIIIIIIIIQ